MRNKFLPWSKGYSQVFQIFILTHYLQQKNMNRLNIFFSYKIKRGLEFQQKKKSPKQVILRTFLINRRWKRILINFTNVSKSICSSENCCSKFNKFNFVKSSFIVWQLSSTLVSSELEDNDIGADEFLEVIRNV